MNYQFQLDQTKFCKASSCRQPTATGIVSCCGCTEASDWRETTRGLRRQRHVKPKKMYIWGVRINVFPTRFDGTLQTRIEVMDEELKKFFQRSNWFVFVQSVQCFRPSSPSLRHLAGVNVFSSHPSGGSPIASSNINTTSHRSGIFKPMASRFSQLGWRDEGVGDQIGRGDGSVVFCVSDGTTNEIRWVYPA